jgi:hypothetical protein
MATQSGKQPNEKFLLLAGACMASCGWVDVLLYLVTRRTIVYQHSLQTTSQAITGGVGGIQMNPALPYGNNTVIGGGGGMTMHSGHHDSPSVSSSQENFVKLEQVVQVTVERATPGEQAAAEAAQKQLRGNPTYW